MEYAEAALEDNTVANEGRDAPETPLPTVLYSANKMWSVRSSPVFQTDQIALFRGEVTFVFLKITLKAVMLVWHWIITTCKSYFA